MERTPQEAKELIAKAIEILNGGARAISISDRIDFQRGRSQRSDYLDWACWFLKHGDNLPPWLLPAWYAYIGRRSWSDSHRRKSEIAVERFALLVPTDLWAEGGRIEI
jgi:hypothetical protein